jgi:hypothetical protein
MEVPLDAAYVPATQSVQFALPADGVIEPAAQSSHGVARIGSELAVPVEHLMQSLEVTDAMEVEYMYIPGPQAVHVAVPFVLEKEPGEHFVHVAAAA